MSRTGRTFSQLSFKVNGVNVDVTISDSGVFEADGPNAERFVDKSFEGLKRKIRDAYRQTGKIRIPATLFHPGTPPNPNWDEDGSADEFESVDITGRHPRSRNISLVNIETNATSHVYNSKEILRRLTKDENCW